MPLTNVTRRSIIDAAEVVDTPLKLNKIYNYKIMSMITITYYYFFFGWGGGDFIGGGQYFVGGG